MRSGTHRGRRLLRRHRRSAPFGRCRYGTVGFAHFSWHVMVPAGQLHPGPLAAIQADPGVQSALVVQGLALQAPSREAHTTFPSVLRSQKQ